MTRREIVLVLHVQGLEEIKVYSKFGRLSGKLNNLIPLCWDQGCMNHKLLVRVVMRNRGHCVAHPEMRLQIVRS